MSRRNPHPSLKPLFDAMTAANLGNDEVAKQRCRKIAGLLRAAETGDAR